MTKAEIASYLVSLHTLMEAQSKGQRSIPSNFLAEEYEKHWKLLKDEMKKESTDETRNRPNNHISNETGAEFTRSESERDISDWPPNKQPAPGSVVRRPGD